MEPLICIIETPERNLSPRLQSLLAREALLRILRTHFGMHALPVMKCAPSGKPYFPAHPHIHFNLSHCRSAVMAIVSDQEVGCDIEDIAAFQSPVTASIPHTHSSIPASPSIPALASTHAQDIDRAQELATNHDIGINQDIDSNHEIDTELIAAAFTAEEQALIKSSPTPAETAAAIWTAKEAAAKRAAHLPQNWPSLTPSSSPHFTPSHSPHFTPNPPTPPNLPSPPIHTHHPPQAPYVYSYT